MNVCLVSAATATDFEDTSDAQSNEVRLNAEVPQLGVLALAAVLEQRGIQPAILNLNHCYYDYIANGFAGVDGFAGWAAEAILFLQVDVCGFSSICSSYPLTIRIAEQVKKSRPATIIVLGGPQASVVDRETLAAFPFVDFVVRGEAEESFPLFLDELSGNGRFSSVPGLTYRSPFGPVRNSNAPVIDDLDSLPLPAYHLTGELLNATTAPLELGRGCPFACSFCSTNDFFRRKFRLKSPDRMLADMRAIASAYGIRTFDLTHDMFTVDRRRVVAFCETMRDCGEKFAWSCSARTDCVDEELLTLMVESGCTGIFFGVEVGSQRMQRVIEKDLDVGRAREIITLAERLGIETTVSMISGFPEETWDDVRSTVDVYMHSLRHPGSTPQFNLLAPLAETPIHSKYRDQLTLGELCSDMGHQGRSQNPLDRELIRKYPGIFPNFYLLPLRDLDRDCLLELREFLLLAPRRLRWLMVALHQTTSGILDIFFAWRERRTGLHPGLRGWDLRAYYLLEQARAEFVRFVREQSGESASPVVRCLVDYHQALARAKETQPRILEEEVPSSPAPTDVPILAPQVHIMELEWDMQGAIDSLKRAEPAPAIDRSLRFFRTQAWSDGDLRLVETRPIIAVGLQACDGQNSISDFVDQLSNNFVGTEEFRRLAAECLLDTLQGEHLIEIRRPAGTKSHHAMASCPT